MKETEETWFHKYNNSDCPLVLFWAITIPEPCSIILSVDSQRVSWDHPKRQQTMCNFDDFNHHFYFHRHLNCNSGLNVVSHVQKKDHCMKSSIVNKGM